MNHLIQLYLGHEIVGGQMNRVIKIDEDLTAAIIFVAMDIYA